MRDKLDEANPAWPVGQTERRLEFVDIPITCQTGAFYVGTFIRHPKKQAHFLTLDQVGQLSQELQNELVNLWVPADATRGQRHNALLNIKAGMLSIPFISLERVDDPFEGSIDALLLDAAQAQRDRPSLARLDLNESGCIYPQDAWKRHFQELEERALTKEFDAEEVSLRKLEAKEQCERLAAEVAKLKLLEQNESTSLVGASSTNKRRRESDSESLTTVQPSSLATFVTGPVPAVLNNSASSPIPPQLPAATNLVAPPPSPGSQPLEDPFGHFQTYRDLAPIPGSVIDGVPVALINCGYHPRRLASSLLEAIPPPQLQAGGSDLVRRCVIVPSCRIVWLDRPTSRYHRSRGLLLQNPIPNDDSWDPMQLQDDGKWSDDQKKALLQPYEQVPYDGTAWHGIYRRIPLDDVVRFLGQEDLSDLPHEVKTSLSRTVPDHLREAVKSIFPDAVSNPSSLDEAIWSLVIETGTVKIPVVLISFCDIGTESLHAARLSRQGPGHLRTLLAADPHGYLHTPRNGHEKVLERLAKVEHRIEEEEGDLQDITNLFQDLTLEHERILDESSRTDCPRHKRLRLEESQNESSNQVALSEPGLPTNSSFSVNHNSSNSSTSGRLSHS
ncbi:hypothetical protein FS837_006163 [Tulasnella sp. UAMH 9824]|nr:hypothetical protein FS837_006163 [Tulasnella sp. UAMH 9824]